MDIEEIYYFDNLIIDLHLRLIMLQRNFNTPMPDLISDPFCMDVIPDFLFHIIVLLLHLSHSKDAEKSEHNH